MDLSHLSILPATVTHLCQLILEENDQQCGTGLHVNGLVYFVYLLKMKEESSAALGDLRRQLEAGHQASVTQLKAHWLSEREAELQQQVTSLVASAKAAWEEQQQQQVTIPQCVPALPTPPPCGR